MPIFATFLIIFRKFCGLRLVGVIIYIGAISHSLRLGLWSWYQGRLTICYKIYMGLLYYNIDYAKPFENLLYSRISGDGFFICCTYKNFGG